MYLEKQPPLLRVTEAPFKEAEQQDEKLPEPSFSEHNKESVWRSASVSSLITQGTAKTRETAKTMKKRNDIRKKNAILKKENLWKIIDEKMHYPKGEKTIQFQSFSSDGFFKNLCLS